MSDRPFERILLSNGMGVEDAIRYLASLRLSENALAPSERELLTVAEGLLDLVRQGATIYMDSAAIEADLYGTTGSDGGIETRPRPSDALRGCDQVALQAVFDRYGITDVQIFGSVAKGTDQPGSDLDLLITTPDVFSLFTAIDLADELEALLGVPVDLVTNDPGNQGETMTAIRGAAIPLRQAIAASSSEPPPTPALQRARAHRQRRLRQITSEWQSVGRLLSRCPEPTAVLSDLGWDKESIAFWLTAPNGYLPQHANPAQAWVTGDTSERDWVIYAARQAEHV